MSAKQKAGGFNSVLITGDVAVDTYVYEGERDSSRKVVAPGTKEVKELGGAQLIYKILK